MKRVHFIYLTSFVCGMSVMAIELSASRLLAPTFGTSSIVWTLIIGLIMISLSLGNIFGGRLADKHNNMDKIYIYIWIAGVWTAFIPIVGKYIITLVVGILVFILPQNLIVTGSTISCLVIFSLPLILLGMVPPYLVKMGVLNIENSGKTTGEIYALSTIGSIIGTFIPTFLTIPLIGTSRTFVVFAVLLNSLSIIYFVFAKKFLKKQMVSMILILLSIFMPNSNSYAFWEKGIVYEGESKYNYLKVSEDKESIKLSTNVAFGVQSIYMKNSILSGFYQDYCLMAPYFMKNFNKTNKMDMLILGLGTGTYAKESKHFFPNCNIDGVEIDEKIVDLSKKYFNLKDEEVKTYVNDGRTFLRTIDKKKYDIIMIDAYHDITIPFHMCTKEFFNEVKSNLKENGVVVINVNIRSKSNDTMVEYLSNTINSNFEFTQKVKIRGSTNTVIFSSNDVMAKKTLSENILKIDDEDLLVIAHYVENNLEENKKDQNKILFDDLAPVETIGQKILDEIIKDEVDGFKQDSNYKEKGILGVLESLSE